MVRRCDARARRFWLHQSRVSCAALRGGFDTGTPISRARRSGPRRHLATRPTTTTTAPPPPPRQAGPAEPQSGPGTQARSTDSIWSALSRCEAGGRPDAVSRSGKYFGAFQFSLATWRGIGMTG